MVGRQRFELSTEAFLRAPLGLATTARRHGQALAPLDTNQATFIQKATPEAPPAADSPLTPSKSSSSSTGCSASTLTLT
jgi:hypothetical protein